MSRENRGKLSAKLGEQSSLSEGEEKRGRRGKKKREREEEKRERERREKKKTPIFEN